jgi:hypothetical protein
MNKMKRNDKLREVGLQRLTGDFRAFREGEERKTLSTNVIGNVIGGVGNLLLLRRKKDSFKEEFGVPGMTNQCRKVIREKERENPICALWLWQSITN